MASSHLLLILEFQTHVYIMAEDPGRRAALKCECLRLTRDKITCWSAQHELVENVQKPVEGVTTRLKVFTTRFKMFTTRFKVFTTRLKV